MIIPPGEGRQIELGPNTLKVKLAAADSSGAFFVGEHTISPNWEGPPPHVHDAMDHLFYVLEGQLTIVAAGETHIASAGAVAFLPRGLVHGFGNLTSRPTRLLEINLPAGFEAYYEGLEELFADGSANPSTIGEVMARFGTRTV
jgi:mannose-6-phosphate isomerase-like protein (cupin superfamily)